MSNPHISVIIPTHNRGALLREMLICLSSQTCPAERFEVITVLDGGDDNTVEMLESLRTPYALHYVRQEQAGVAVARNHGARLARGAVLVFLDDDLLPMPNLIQEHARAHLYQEPLVVLGRLLPDLGGSGGEKGGWNTWEERVLTNHYRAMQEGRRPPSGRRLYSGNFSVSRQPFLSIGGFDERLQRGEDVELGFRLEQLGLRFSFSSQAAAIHRGYRSFESWCNSAYLYGRTDVCLYTQKGFQVMPELFRWYFHQPALARWAAEICTDRPRVRKSAIWGLRVASDILTKAGAHHLAHPGYSGVYKLQYWQGVSDELGGKDRFQRVARQWEQSMPRGGAAT